MQHVVYKQHAGVHCSHVAPGSGSAVTWPRRHTPAFPPTNFVTMDGLLFISLNLSLVTCKTGHRNRSPKDVESLETNRHVVGAELNDARFGEEIEAHDSDRPKQAGGP